MAALPKLRQSDSSLEDEIQLIEAYLRIQQVRIGTRLSYDITVPERLKGVRVPAVMLLTLVENAIKHGVAPHAEGGDVHVTAMQEAAMLILRVTDNGRGLQTKIGNGSGLANVNARLALLYRNRASFSLEPGSPRGVVASIKIPMDATV
jgi:LytS/YehU family sensor histidine kinase